MTQAPPIVEEATLPELDLDEWEAWRASVEAEAGLPDAGTTVQWRPALAIVVVVGALLAFVVYAFQGPVAAEWYHARQDRLAAEFALPHTHVPVGGPAAVLEVPRLGMKLYVVQGDQPAQLRGGPGHRVGTPFPGAKGNSVIVGHRDAWGGPFGDLEQLRRLLKANLRVSIVSQPRPGEPVTWYTVRHIEKVDASDTHLLVPSTDHRLTLVTDAGAGKRLMVVAVSGTEQPLSSKTAGVRATTPGPALIFDMTTSLALIAFAMALAAFVLMTGRFRIPAMAAVMVPLLAAGLFALLLEVDGALAPLR